MANITAADILVGSDEDFVINLYLAVLGRWPDPTGFAHMVAKVAGSEAARAQAITDMAVVPEALARGRPVPVQDPLLPAEPVTALQRQLALRTEYLRGLFDAQQAAMPPGLDEVEPLLAEARADMTALRRELREGLAALHASATRNDVEPLLREARAEMVSLRRELRERLAVGGGPGAAQDAGPDIADYVNDLLAVAEARMELRLRALEKRLP